ERPDGLRLARRPHRLFLLTGVKFIFVVVVGEDRADHGTCPDHDRGDESDPITEAHLSIFGDPGPTIRAGWRVADVRATAGPRGATPRGRGRRGCGWGSSAPPAPRPPWASASARGRTRS